ncbi:MAG: type II toxin-antitoxin system prevent-host-death family antitoxin [Phycisphaerae bacterium]|nr:type II toxin-antitoxin system prevent-host-death family antitoxin [Phycisphaerae bacterium]MBM92396.1 type II toxin-antitoxin system prevent-host-death family antitoxin [Phycisphaerae bacterium]HCT43824.1 type II toxin-antitoxin system prevent-host-death family antitoxin [Phycisphaerales bacterium]|tara:strand:- start:184 stop:423 length:240 start_codon:yes stop_codon:yes gene_type:complete
MRIINTHEAKTHLSKLLECVARGEEIIIAKAGKPIARLVGYELPKHQRTGGHWKGLVRVGDDFDAPLPEDLNDAFGVDR